MQAIVASRQARVLYAKDFLVYEKIKKHKSEYSGQDQEMDYSSSNLSSSYKGPVGILLSRKWPFIQYVCTRRQRDLLVMER